MSITASLPTTRREARAQGLKTYNMGLACRRHAGAPRLTSTGKCTSCIDYEKATLRALKARIKERLVATAKAQALREIARDAKARATEETRAAAKAEQAALKEAATNEARAAKAKATRALKAQATPPSAVAEDLPPWA